MKKIISIALSLTLMFLLVACGAGDTGEPTTVDLAAAQTAISEVDIDGAVLGDIIKPNTDTEVLKTVYRMDMSSVSEFVALTPLMNIQASMVILVKPLEGEKDNVKNMMNDALVNYQKQWDAYLPDQAVLVENKVITEIGDTLVYIISPNNDAVLDAVRSAAV